MGVINNLTENSSTLATLCEELTHWKRLWCWEGLGAGGEGDVRGWDGWMASPTQWTWVWVNSGSWWWTGRPGMLRFMGLQRVRHNWATELNWTEHIKAKIQNQISFTTAQKSETFRCKSTNHVQDLNAKNYRMFQKKYCELQIMNWIWFFHCENVTMRHTYPRSNNRVLIEIIRSTLCKKQYLHTF